MEIDYTEKRAKKLLVRMKRPQSLEQFSQRLSQFIPHLPHHEPLLKLAEEAFQLFQEYPTRTIFNSVPYMLFATEEYTLDIDSYLGFVWKTGHDSLSQFISENFNQDFSDCGCIIEPGIFQSLAKPCSPLDTSFSFEIRLLKLISKLDKWLCQPTLFQDSHAPKRS